MLCSSLTRGEYQKMESLSSKIVRKMQSFFTRSTPRSAPRTLADRAECQRIVRNMCWECSGNVPGNRTDGTRRGSRQRAGEMQGQFCEDIPDIPRSGSLLRRQFARRRVCPSISPNFSGRLILVSKDSIFVKWRPAGRCATPARAQSVYYRRESWISRV